MITRPFLWFAPLVCLAVFAVFYLGLPWFFCPILGGLACLLFRRFFKAQFLGVFALILLLLFGLRSSAVLNQRELLNQAANETVRAQITIVSATSKSNVVQARCTAKEAGLRGAEIEIHLKEKTLSVGDRAVVDLTLSNYEDRDELSVLSDDFVGSSTIEEIHSIGPKVHLFSFAHTLRTKLNSLLIAHLPADESATLSALVLGDRSRLTSPISTAARRSGITHVFVVSGFHLSILVGSLMRFLKKLCGHPLFLFFSTLLSVTVLCAVCGFSNSVLRAGLTFLLCSIAPLFLRENDSLNTLGVAVVIMLFLDPFCLFSLSFQLTVLSTFGILVFHPALTEAIQKHPPFLVRTLADVSTLSLCAMCFTVPVLVACFGEISLIAPVTNLFIGFAVTAALLLTVIGGILSFLPVVNALAPVFFSAAGMMARYLNEVAFFFSKPSFATVKIPKSASLLLWLIALLGLALFFHQSQKRKKARYEKVMYGEK